MADIRISAADLAFIGSTAKKIGAAGDSLAPQLLQSFSVRIQAALQSAVEHVDSVADALRIFEPSRRRELRHVLETAQGAAGGAASVAGLAALVPDPRLKIAVLAAGATIGAFEGARLESIRVEIQRAHNEVDRANAAIERLFLQIDRSTARLKAARKRTGWLG